MKTKEFQEFVEQLGDLSESQRQVVIAALKGKGSANDAIRLNERQFDADPCCGHCGTCSLGKWGTAGVMSKTCFQHGQATDQRLADLESRTIATYLAPVVESDAVLVSDGRPAYVTFAKERGLLHISIIASRGEHVYQGFHLQNVNNYTNRLKGWMGRFNGVAVRYLDNYLGWWRMIDRDGDRLTMTRVLAAASAYAAT